VTTSISGLVYPRGSMPPKVTDAILSAAEAGQSSLFSSGIEPGFGADLFPIALMSMSHKVYSVRGIEITNYSEYGAEYDMRELFGFGQPLDYQGRVEGARHPALGLGRCRLRWSPTHWGSNSTTSVRRASFRPPRATSPPRSDSSKRAPSAPPGQPASASSTA